MLACPQCRGNKKLTVSVHENGKDSSFDMECLTCHGQGEVTDVTYQSYQRFRNSWCKCGNKSKEVHFLTTTNTPKYLNITGVVVIVA